MTLNPLKWFGAGALESTVLWLLKFSGSVIKPIAGKVWQSAKETVLRMEDEGGLMSGSAKYTAAVTMLLKLFPSLTPMWAGAIIQLAWLVLEHTVFQPQKEEASDSL
jgi:hypothetical protein